MLTELTRLNSHLVWLGTHALDIGAMTVFLYCFREREDILRIFEMFSGQRMMTSYFRIGGLALEPPRGWRKRVETFHRRLPEQSGRVRGSAHQQPHLDRPHEGRGLHDARGHDATSGVTGPMLRASGLKIDARKDEPYSSYDQFDFEVPIRPESDVYARYLVRVAEMRQSAQHHQAGCGRMPSEAPWRADGSARRAAGPRQMKTSDGGADLPLQDRDRGLPSRRPARSTR